MIAPALACALLEDGSLTLTAEPASAGQVRHWLPHLPNAVREPDAPEPDIGFDVAEREPAPGAPEPGLVATQPEPGPAPSRGRAPSTAGSIEVTLRERLPDPPTSRPALTLGPVTGWISGPADRITLHARGDLVAGTIDLARLTATVWISPAAPHAEPRRADVFSALTLSAAFLLNRMRRALMHAAAVAAPDGRAWLLVGDAFAGKTTTTVNLISAGWHYLSDDHIVLGRAPDGTVRVEGWPRAFHLDRGYEKGVSTGERIAIDPTDLAPGRWRRTAPLAGVLFPVVETDRPTAAASIAAADALARLVRQSPWLLADPPAARDVLSLLRDIARRPVFMLRLGRDSYRDPERLIAALDAAWRAP